MKHFIICITFLLPFFVDAQNYVGINTDNPQFTLDMRSTSPILGGNFQLGNQNADHFLRLFPGHDQDPKPFMLFNQMDTFRIASSAPDFADFKERLTIQPGGNIGISIGQPSNRLHVHDPDVYTIGEEPFIFTFGDPNYIQITNGVLGTSDSSGLRIGVEPGGKAQILHPDLITLNSGGSKLSLNGSLKQVLLDSNVIVTGDVRVNSLAGQGQRTLVTDATGNISAITEEETPVYQHQKGFSNSTTWVVPTGVTRIKVELWGGGGGGASGGGGAAGSYLQGYLDVSQGELVTITIGSAGAGSSSAGGDSGDGGHTIVSITAGSYTAFGGDGAASNTPGGSNPGGIASGTMTEYSVFPGGFGHSNNLSWNQTSSIDFVKIIHYGAGGDAFRFPGSGGPGRVRVENASNNNLIEFQNGKVGAIPGGGGGGSDFGYNGGPGYAIVYW